MLERGLTPLKITSTTNGDSLLSMLREMPLWWRQETTVSCHTDILHLSYHFDICLSNQKAELHVNYYLWKRICRKFYEPLALPFFHWRWISGVIDDFQSLQDSQRTKWERLSRTSSCSLSRISEESHSREICPLRMSVNFAIRIHTFGSAFSKIHDPWVYEFI